VKTRLGEYDIERIIDSNREFLIYLGSENRSEALRAGFRASLVIHNLFHFDSTPAMIPVGL